MIRFSLICEHEHEFEGWFASTDDYDKQCKSDLVSCPHCGSAKIEKSLMAPSVSTARKKDVGKETLQGAIMGEAQREYLKKVRELRDTMLKDSVDVGNDFASEARKIHLGNSDKKSVHGNAGAQEARELIEEGIEIMPIPTLPDDAN